jgi:hypothetical protein
MSDPLIDFQCWVGKYEIKRFDALDKKYQEYIEAANMPHLVQVGPAKLIRPSSKALSYAVGLLLQTKMPKWWAAEGLDPDPVRAAKMYSQRLIISEEEEDFDPEELSLLKRNVLLIARNIGMLTGGGADPQTQASFEDDEDGYVFYHEPLRAWIDLAGWIQRIFALREHKKDFDIPIGPLSIFLSNRSGQPISMQIRPDSTNDTLLYIAASMVARGTAVQTCNKCGKPFLEGGERDPRNKKRAGSRFCSDKCRYEYHNEERRKAKSISKSKSKSK